MDCQADRDCARYRRGRSTARARAGKCRQQVTADIHNGLTGDQETVPVAQADSDTVALSSAWLTGPQAAALAEIEVPEELEPPTVVPTRESGDGFEDHVRMYLREIGTVHLLTWDGEKRLARAMEAGNYLQDVIRAHVEADGPASTRAIYCEMYRRYRNVFRFALADARVDSPDAAPAEAIRRATQLADMDPEHVRAVAASVAALPEEAERALVEGSMLSQILASEVLDWTAARQQDGQLPELGVFESEFLATADPESLEDELA